MFFQTGRGRTALLIITGEFLCLASCALYVRIVATADSAWVVRDHWKMHVGKGGAPSIPRTCA